MPNWVPKLTTKKYRHERIKAFIELEKFYAESRARVEAEERENEGWSVNDRQIPSA